MTTTSTDKIDSAASKAVDVIYHAAENAAKVISNSAADALRVVNTANSNDHDLLIRLETKMEGLKDDIRSIKDGLNSQISNHELRLIALEKVNNVNDGKTKITLPILMLMASLAGGVVVYIVQLLIK